jgi:hypothetical protein
VPTEIGMIIGVGMRLAGRRADHGGGAPVLDDYDVVSAPLRLHCLWPAN